MELNYFATRKDSNTQRPSSILAETPIWTDKLDKSLNITYELLFLQGMRGRSKYGELYCFTASPQIYKIFSKSKMCTAAQAFIMVSVHWHGA